MKVSLSKDTGKKYRHNLSSNVYTTARVGFCQPINCRECAAQDTLKLRTANMVYLNPVVKPTFGRLSIKQYKNFVPIEDIWHPFGSFMAQKPYAGAVGGSYIPTEVPSLPLSYLSTFVCLCSEIVVFKASSSGTQSVYNVKIGTDSVQATSSTDLAAAITSWRTSVSISGEADLLNAAFTYAANNNFYKFDTNAYTLEDLGRFDWFFYTVQRHLICGRFTERGKNLRKVLLGLGYQITFDNDWKTILPIVAFYKSWFDLFAIQRDITWKDTRCYAMMEFQEQSSFKLTRFISPNSTYFCDWFFKDLPNCYYTISPDFASAHINALGLHTQSDERQMVTPNDTSAGDVVSSVKASAYETPVLPSGLPVSQEGLNILKALYERINKKTAIGGRIKEFMRVVFGAQYDQEDESLFIGATSFNVDITQVMSTAETQEGWLGEYAGKGVGQNSGEGYTFTARKQGFYIEFFAIVPDSRLAQAIDPNLSHTTRTTFFDPKFDSLTLLPSRKSAIYGTYDLGISGHFDMLNTGFGNIPNFMEYKVSFDKINGDMSMRSTRDSYLPFTLAKLLPYTGVFDQAGASGSTVDFKVIQNFNSNLITNGNFWRYIGRDRWFGNFDRLFVNDGNAPSGINSETLSRDNLEYRLDDNYVLYFYCEVDLSGYELPISGSWQTGAGSGDSVTVEKA